MVFTVLLTHKCAVDEKLTKFVAENQVTRFHHDYFYQLQLSYM
jgi:hypothetical protein